MGGEKFGGICHFNHYSGYLNSTSSRNGFVPQRATVTLGNKRGFIIIPLYMRKIHLNNPARKCGIGSTLVGNVKCYWNMSCLLSSI
jgi:hypothetical protein